MVQAFSIVILAGPNGAGKTTVSREVLAGTLGIEEFVNADVIAAGLSGFSPDRAAFAAGRIMLARLRELAAARRSFAFETTLATRTFAPWLSELRANGARVHLFYTSLESPRLAISRVRARVRAGGHHVPDDVVTRRFQRSASNFWRLYVPIVDSWKLYDNSGENSVLVASAFPPMPPIIVRPFEFRRFMEIGDAGEDTSGNDD